MSEFVNYQKRDASLAGGCKDLIDVLRLKEHEPGGGPSPGSIWEEFFGKVRTRELTVKLSEVEKYVQSAARSSRRGERLEIMPPPKDIRISVRCAGQSGIGLAMVRCRAGTEIDAPVKEFFERQSLPIANLAARSPNLANLYSIYSLPREVTVLARLIVELCREVCKMSDDGELRVFETEHRERL